MAAASSATRQLELGVLDRDRGVAVLRFSRPVRDELVERGDAEPTDPAPDSDRVLHGIAGPADVTAVLELFDRRYRDLRGEDDPYRSGGPSLTRSSVPTPTATPRSPS